MKRLGWLIGLLVASVALLARYLRRPASPETGTVTTLIVDSFNHRVIEVNPAKAIVWQYGTTGAPGSGDNQLAAPSDAERLANGNTLITDSGNHRAIEVTPDKRIVWWYGAAVSSEPDWMEYPFAAAKLANGNTLIADQGGSRVIEVDASGAILWQYGGTFGSGENQLNNPYDANGLMNGNALIADGGNHRVIEVNASKAIVWQYGTTGTAGSGENQLSEPLGVIRLASGNTLIADTRNDRVIEVSPSKTIAWQYNATHLYPLDAKRLPNGNTLITSTGDYRVIEVDPNGTIVWQYGTTGTAGSGENQLDNPREASRLGVAVLQPDLMIRILQDRGQPRDSTYIGGGIYNLDGVNQTADNRFITPSSLRTDAYRTSIFALKLENDGNVTDRFAVSAAASGSPALIGEYAAGWRVRYFDALSGGTDITDPVTGPGWIPISLAPGESLEFRVEVTNLTRGSGEEIYLLVTAASMTDPSKKDAVKVVAKAQHIL